MSLCENLTNDAIPRGSVNLSMVNISTDNLYLMEKDLLFCEKVSVCFLLCGKPQDVPYILEKLNLALKIHRQQNLGACKPHESSIITEWARNADPEDKWKEHLVEALAIVKSNRVLRKLGFNLSDLREMFHPDIDEFVVHVHPVLKILFRMCEGLTPSECLRLIRHMREKYCENFVDFGVDSEKYLEIYLLNWIKDKEIMSIGDDRGNGAHFKELLTFLKSNEHDNFLDKLMKFTKISSDANTLQELGENLPQIVQMRKNSRDYFVLNRKSMGHVLVINQKTFHKEENRAIDYYLLPGPLETRHGTETDVEKLKKTFSSFGFNVGLRNDLKSTEILAAVEEFAGMTEERHSCLVVVILSHGIEGSVYGVDSIPVKVNQIKRILCAEHLENKPKILIVQACQGNESSLEGKLSTDAPSGSELTAAANLITAWSTVEGFNSMRHTTQGTWFIQTLCQKLIELHQRDHFADILTEVIAEVRAKIGDGGERMLPKFDSTLTKKLFFPPITG
ncbi:Caspase-8 [Sergentomyia squamirostris]